MEDFLSTSKKAIIEQSIFTGKRLSGRTLFEQRPLKILYNTSKSGVYISLGKTEVFCKITTNITEPRKNRQSEGKFLLKINLNNLLNKKKNIREKSDEITKILEKTIKGSKALDVESLNIKIGKFCWEIILELTLLKNDGNITDAMNYAALAILLKYEYKPFKIEKKEIKITKSLKNKKFSLNHIPILQTFAILNKNGEFLIFDPDQNEENVCNGNLSIAVNLYGDICCVHKPGDSIISYDLMKKVFEFCTKKAKDVCEVFKRFVLEDGGDLEVFKEDDFFRGGSKGNLGEMVIEG